ncbi:MAG: hypothetical protein ACJAT1_001432 [Marivirga sp.]|jgi:hypothetical protein
MKILKSRILTLSLSSIFLVASSSLGADCDAGGPGAGGCQFKSVVSIFGIALWSVEGSSVSGCAEGTYACCTAESATCEPN